MCPQSRLFLGQQLKTFRFNSPGNREAAGSQPSTPLVAPKKPFASGLSKSRQGATGVLKMWLWNLLPQALMLLLFIEYRWLKPYEYGLSIIEEIGKILSQSDGHSEFYIKEK